MNKQNTRIHWINTELNKNSNFIVFLGVDRLLNMIHATSFLSRKSARKAARPFHRINQVCHGQPTVIICGHTPFFSGKLWFPVVQKPEPKITPSSAYPPETDRETDTAKIKLQKMILTNVIWYKSNCDEYFFHNEVAFNFSFHFTTPFALYYFSQVKYLTLSLY